MLQKKSCVTIHSNWNRNRALKKNFNNFNGDNDSVITCWRVFLRRESVANEHSLLKTFSAISVVSNFSPSKLSRIKKPSDFNEPRIFPIASIELQTVEDVIMTSYLLDVG